jgi:hypothetical protein
MARLRRKRTKPARCVPRRELGVCLRQTPITSGVGLRQPNRLAPPSQIPLSNPTLCVSSNAPDKPAVGRRILDDWSSFT